MNPKDDTHYIEQETDQERISQIKKELFYFNDDIIFYFGGGGNFTELY